MAKEILLQVEGPTETITLSGERDERGTWRLWVERGGEEERREWDDWLDALLTLDENPWEEYEPVTVHPEFRSKVWGPSCSGRPIPRSWFPGFRPAFPKNRCRIPGSGRRSARCPVWRR